VEATTLRRASKAAASFVFLSMDRPPHVEG
jgi:hypothetical protein